MPKISVERTDTDVVMAALRNPPAFDLTLRAGLAAAVIQAAIIDPHAAFVPLLAAELKVSTDKIVAYMSGSDRPHDSMVPVVLASVADALERLRDRAVAPSRSSSFGGYGC